MYYYVYPQYYTGQQYYRADGQNDEVLEALINGMEGESQAIDFYSRLVKMAPNKVAKESVEHALSDERTHLKLFINLYKQLTGRSPSYNKPKASFDNFKEGIMIAFYDELEAYETYRDDYLLTQNQMIRDVFFQAMSDEIEHATRFGFIYQTL